MLVCHRAHDGTDRQAVEIVVDENEDAEADGRKLCAFAGFDSRGCPGAECSRSACPVHELNHNAQDDQEHEDADIV